MLSALLRDRSGCRVGVELGVGRYLGVATPRADDLSKDGDCHIPGTLTPREEGGNSSRGVEW